MTRIDPGKPEAPKWIPTDLTKPPLTPKRRVTSVLPHRAQRAFPPGGSGAIRCSRSQSGQAIVSTVTPRHRSGLSDVRAYSHWILPVAHPLKRLPRASGG